MAVMLGLAFGQERETSQFYHSNVYFQPQQVVLDMLGEPSHKDSSEVIMPSGFTKTVTYAYDMANGHESVWLVFSEFSVWFPDYDFVKEFENKLVVVSIIYHPVLPPVTPQSLDRYFNE